MRDSGSTALCVVLVEGERVIVVNHGWGASGAHVDVRCFVGAEPDAGGAGGDRGRRHGDDPQPG